MTSKVFGVGEFKYGNKKIDAIYMLSEFFREQKALP